MRVEYVMHIGVCVRDLDRAVRFYTEGLGFEESGRIVVDDDATAQMLGLDEVELHAVYLDRDALRLELLHYARPGTVGEAGARPMNQPGLTHFAVRVSDRDAAVEKLVSLGGRVLEHSRVENEDWGSRLVYVLDPDGTRLELVETEKDPTRP